MGLVVEAFNRGVLNRAVHAFDLAIGPRMLWLGQPVLDIVLGAGVFEWVRPEDLAGRDSLFDSKHWEPGLRGSVKWMPLSVRTVWMR